MINEYYKQHGLINTLFWFNNQIGKDQSAHIVLEDHNVNDEAIRFCLNKPNVSNKVRDFLNWLLTIPETDRMKQIDEYYNCPLCGKWLTLCDC